MEVEATLGLEPRLPGPLSKSIASLCLDEQPQSHLQAPPFKWKNHHRSPPTVFLCSGFLWNYESQMFLTKLNPSDSSTHINKYIKSSKINMEEFGGKM